MLRHRTHVVGQQDATFLCSPFQDGRIFLPRKADILCTHDIQGRLFSEYAAKDIVVKVLVNEEAELRGHGLATRRASKRSRTPCDGKRNSFSCWTFSTRRW